ncbi:MAG: phospholipase D-like domain-containing protein [Kosmotogaceae bacterium]
MIKDSSNKINEILMTIILKEIIDKMVSSGGKLSQKEAIDGYSGPPQVKESEIRSAIEWGIQKNYLSRDLNSPRDSSVLSLTSEEIRNEFTNKVDLVMSIPELTELGLRRIQIRNAMIETREAFRYLFKKAKNILRISSPFFQANILEDDGIPEIKELFSEKFQSGCEIRILSREIFHRRSSEFRWLKKFSEEEGFSHLLRIYDYHLESTNRAIVSSTHSKMLIADSSLAYVGSGEFRKNSLAHNFEIGCLIQGPIVTGLCESFDLMTRYAREWGDDFKTS